MTRPLPRSPFRGHAITGTVGVALGMALASSTGGPAGCLCGTPTPGATGTPTPTMAASTPTIGASTPSNDPYPGILYGVQLLGNEPTYNSRAAEIIRTRVIGVVPAGGVAAVDWSWFDGSVAKAESLGAKVLLEYWVRSPSTLAVPGDCSTLDAGTHEAFSRALAWRYRGRVWAYEVDNEVESCATPVAYAERFARAYLAIKSADPAVRVVHAGLTFDSTAGRTWAINMLRALRTHGGTTDWLNIHFYDDSRPWNLGGLVPRANALRSYSEQAGLGVPPLAMTEGGDDTGATWRSPDNEVEQAEGVARVLAECRQAGAVVCILFKAADSSADDYPSRPAGQFGLFDYTGRARAAWQEFLRVVP